MQIGRNHLKKLAQRLVGIIKGELKYHGKKFDLNDDSVAVVIGSGARRNSING